MLSRQIKLLELKLEKIQTELTKKVKGYKFVVITNKKKVYF